MSASISAFDAKNRLGQLLDRVESGEQITITRHGRPVAALVPLHNSDKVRVQQALKTFRSLRQALAKRGSKPGRGEIRRMIDLGRR